MELSERFGWLILGGAVGFVLGYIVARLREIGEEVAKIDENTSYKRNESGFAMTTLAVPVVVLITAFAAFASARVSNQLDHTVTCITQYNVHQGEALSSRDSAIKEGTQSEIDLWTKYAHLYAQAKSDPSKVPQAQEALSRAIMSHRDALIETQATRFQNPYPNPDVLKDCKENAQNE